MQPFEVRRSEATGGSALHALAAFEAGARIAEIGFAQILAAPTYQTLQIDDERHGVVAPEPLLYMNHSCAPTVRLDLKNRLIWAVRAIRPGDELTFFYPSTEWSMARGFQCVCGAVECVGYVQGAAHLPAAVLDRYDLSDHIQSKRAEAAARSE